LNRRHAFVGTHRRGRLRWAIAAAAAAVLSVGVAASAGVISAGHRGGGRGGLPAFTPESLDGSGNNLAHPEWGAAGRAYARVAPVNYQDGISAMPDGPNVRMVS
jgi:Animal haem peroxidase